MKHDMIIILPTHSSYIDICINFIELLKKNWQDCPYRMILAITGENIEEDIHSTRDNSCEKIYCGKQATLTECIRKVTDIYDFEYYMCFLGDAFISKKINSDDIDDAIKEIVKLDVNYCCLYPKQPIKKCKNAGKWIRYINSHDRYSHSFIAFIAKKDFIVDEFQLESTDLDFEVKYLKIAAEKKDYYFDNHVILKKNIFNITPGIHKGKWERIVLFKLKKNNPEMEFSYRPKITISMQLMLIIRNRVFKWIPNTPNVKLLK